MPPSKLAQSTIGGMKMNHSGPHAISRIGEGHPLMVGHRTVAARVRRIRRSKTAGDHSRQKNLATSGKSERDFRDEKLNSLPFSLSTCQ